MASAVQITDVTKAFGDVVAVDNISIDIRDGEFFSLLGPSGCGKTTTLRLIAGFEQPTIGQISIMGRPVAGVPAYRRPVNTVFQSYALFPHMTVAKNVAFGLEMAKVAKADIERRVAEALELVQMGSYGDRRPTQLSGGQKQRVAIARALALEPQLFLMDEPFSALDPLIRTKLQDELLELQQKLKRTIIFVSHDLDEAFKLGNQIAILEGGRIVQWGAPHEIFRNPVNDYVADFVAGISRLKIVKAHAVMQSFEQYTANTGLSVPDDAPLVQEDASLSELIQLAIASDTPIVVQDKGQRAGVITRPDILKTVIEGAETS